VNIERISELDRETDVVSIITHAANEKCALGETKLFNRRYFRQILTDFQNSFTDRKFVKFVTKQLYRPKITHHTYVLPHYLEKLKIFKFVAFLHIIMCSNKRQLPNSWWDFTDRSASLRRIFLTHKQIVNQVNIFFRAALCGLPLPVSLCRSLIFLSTLLMPIFVHHLFGNLFINSVSLYPSTDTSFYQNFIFVAENHVYKHCDGDVCNDVILMPQFLEVS